MAKRFKTRIINGLSSNIGTFVPNPVTVTPHARGVRYFELNTMMQTYFGKVNTFKEGRRYKKHIIARRTTLGGGLFQLYTYHFPTHWSEACVANRNLIKEAQRQAHALEHDHSAASLEWHIRFLHHYYNVFIGGAKPEPGLKPYSRFYQYAYVAIYRQLQAAQAIANAKAEEAAFEPVPDNTFEPASPHSVWTNILRPRKYFPATRQSRTPFIVMNTHPPFI